MLSFMARRPFIADRMSRVLEDVFGTRPMVVYIPMSPLGPGAYVFIAGNLQGVTEAVATNPILAKNMQAWKEGFHYDLPHTTQMTTDDWPYLYLEAPAIPSLYFLLAIMMLLLWFIGKRGLGFDTSVTKKEGLHFFLFGLAFLLLQVQTISRISVVLGSTWWVNAFVITGILIMILLANILVEKKGESIPEALPYVCLVVFCIGLYFLDLTWFASLSYGLRVFLVTTICTSPIFFSGIAFVKSFASCERKDLALGSNLFGSLIGGILQCVTFMTGLTALLLIVALAYALTWFTRSTENLISCT